MMNHVLVVEHKWTRAINEHARELARARQSKPFALEFNGSVHRGVNLTAFAKERGLHQGALTQVLLGRKRQYKGWTRVDNAVKIYEVVGPDDKVHNIKHHSRSSFARAHSLNPYAFCEMLRGGRNSHRGWFLKGNDTSAEARRLGRRPEPTDEAKAKRAAAYDYQRCKPFTVYQGLTKFEGINRSAFCREHGIKSTSGLYLLISGRRSYYCGFTLHPVSQ